MKHVLIANIFGIGDVLFTTPLIASLKKEIEGVRVDYLCNARTRPVVECNPDVDDIFVYEKDDLLKLWREDKVQCIKDLKGLLSSIKKKKYDAVFDFTLSREFGFIFMITGIPRRIGLNYKNRGVFLTDKLAFSGFRDKHVIEYYLELLESVNISAPVKEMQLVPDESLREKAFFYLGGRDIREGSLAAVIPGGGASWGGQASRKRWSPEGFVHVADILANQGIAVAVLGDASERDLCRAVADKMTAKPAILENDLPLKEYIALLSACNLVLCNDGGPLHIAAALEVNTVSIFGPVDEKVYGPYPASDRNRVMTASEVSCRSCYDKFKLPECEKDNICLTGIDPGQVAEACLELLGKEKK